MRIGKKIFVISAAAVILLPGILFMPDITQAFSIDIASFMEQIQKLQAKLNIFKGTSAIPVPSDNSVQIPVVDLKKEAVAVNYNYAQDLAVGSQGADVAALQQMLIDGGYLKISEPTAYFGSVTKTALSAWQKANSINPSGYFGSLSRAKAVGSSGISTNATGTVPALDPEPDNSAENYDRSPASFVKTYHIWDKTEGFGVVPLKNGGYLLTGDIISGAGVFYPFIIKTDAEGDIVWSERSGSPSNTYSISSSRHIGRIAVETTDGNIIMVSDTSDFVSAEYEEIRESYGDVLITGLSSKGVKLWSIMLGDHGTDQPQKLWALPDGGVMLLARFTQIGYGNNISDASVLPKYSTLIKIDKNGQVLMSKKMGWDAIDMALLADGGFIVLANIAIPQAEESQIMDTKTSTAPLPTILRLNSALNVEWAKTMEMIPSELSFPISAGNGSFTVGVTKVRMPGGDFKAVQPTSDGGFIAFGYASLLNEGMSGTTIGGQQLLQYIDLHPFIAVKVDATGKYLWTRKLTGSLFRGSTAIDFQVTKTTDSDFVILQEVVRDKNWQAYEGNGEALAQARAINIELIKTDADFNIIGEDNGFEPHYDVIKSSNQVQIYEMVMGDVNGNKTTSLERGYVHLKDNRLPPEGFTTSHLSYDTIQIVGHAATDPDFNNESGNQGTGSDRVHFHIPLNSFYGEIEIIAKVYYQTVNKRWLDEMFSYTSNEINTFKSFYQNSNRSPVLVAQNSMNCRAGFDIDLSQGWNSLSCFINPDNNDIDSVLSQISHSLIILVGEGGMIYPAGGIHTLTEFDTNKGYSIKLSKPGTLRIRGNVLINKQKAFVAGWNVLPVLAACETAIAELNIAFLNQLGAIVELNGWKVYWPEKQVYSLTSLSPGNAYLVKMNNPAKVVFPTCD